MTQRTAITIPLSELGFSVGTWTRKLVSNVECYEKAAADETPIVFFTVPVPPEFPNARVRNVESIDFFYEVVTAALDAAPTCVARRKTLAAATVPALSTETETEAITGDDTTGTAVGQYRQRVTFSTPVRLDGNDEQLQIENTINAAATTVLRIYAVRVNLLGG